MTELEIPHFVSRPALVDSAPGIVVLHDARGIGASVLRLSEQLSNQGYFVVAPDLYFRAGGTESAPYSELRASLDQAQVDSDVERCATLLREMGSTALGVLGFCFGGSLSYHMATHSETFSAAVGFYGVTLIESLSVPKCPVRLFYGGQDEWLTPAMIEAVMSHHPDTVVYPDAGHGFMHGGPEHFDAKAASDAWPKTLEFFRQHLAT